jgi:hypothetical protein
MAIDPGTLGEAGRFALEHFAASEELHRLGHMAEHRHAMLAKLRNLAAALATALAL